MVGKLSAQLQTLQDTPRLTRTQRKMQRDLESVERAKFESSKREAEKIEKERFAGKHFTSEEYIKEYEKLSPNVQKFFSSPQEIGEAKKQYVFESISKIDSKIGSLNDRIEQKKEKIAREIERWSDASQSKRANKDNRRSHNQVIDNNKEKIDQYEDEIRELERGKGRVSEGYSVQDVMKYARRYARSESKETQWKRDQKTKLKESGISLSPLQYQKKIEQESRDLAYTRQLQKWGGKVGFTALPTFAKEKLAPSAMKWQESYPNEKLIFDTSGKIVGVESKYLQKSIGYDQYISEIERIKKVSPQTSSLNVETGDITPAIFLPTTPKLKILQPENQRYVYSDPQTGKLITNIEEYSTKHKLPLGGEEPSTSFLTKAGVYDIKGLERTGERFLMKEDRKIVDKGFRNSPKGGVLTKNIMSEYEDTTLSSNIMGAVKYKTVPSTFVYNPTKDKMGGIIPITDKDLLLVASGTGAIAKGGVLLGTKILASPLIVTGFEKARDIVLPDSNSILSQVGGYGMFAVTAPVTAPAYGYQIGSSLLFDPFKTSKGLFTFIKDRPIEAGLLTLGGKVRYDMKLPRYEMKGLDIRTASKITEGKFKMKYESIFPKMPTPLKIRNLEIPLAGGKIKTISLLGLETKGGRAIIFGGKTGKGIKGLSLGTPKILSYLKEISPSSEIKLGSALETKAIKRAFKLSPEGSITLRARELIDPFQSLFRKTYRTKSKFMNEKEIFSATQRLPEEAVKIQMDIIKEHKGVLFGSKARAFQLAKEYKIGKETFKLDKVPRDIEGRFDQALPETMADITKLALKRTKELGTIKKGKDVFDLGSAREIKDTPFAIEALINKKWMKISEYKGGDSIIEKEIVPEWVAGIQKTGVPIKTKTGLLSTSLAEELRGVSQGVLRVRMDKDLGLLDIFPSPKRMKDIGSVSVSARTLAESKFFKSGTKRDIEKIESLFSPELVKEQMKKVLKEPVMLADFSKNVEGMSLFPKHSGKIGKVFKPTMFPIGKTPPSISHIISQSSSLKSAIKSFTASDFKSPSITKSASKSVSRSASKSVSHSISAVMSKINSMSASASKSAGSYFSPIKSKTVSPKTSPAYKLTPSLYKSPPSPYEPPIPNIFSTTSSIGKPSILSKKIKKIKKGKKRKKQIDLFGLMPSFTARAIGMKPMQFKSVKDAIKEIRRVKTPFEIGRGGFISKKSKRYSPITEKSLLKGIIK